MSLLFRPIMIALFSPLMISQVANAATATPPSETNNATSTCAAPANAINIKIKTPRGRVVYNTGVSRNDLVRIRQSRSHGVLRNNWRPLGLTLSDFQYRIGTSVRLAPVAGNAYCVYPASFDITIGYSRFTVYIDRRYGKGSCEYRAILDHENTHVSLYRGILSRTLPELQRTIYSTARRIAPIVVNDPDQGVQYVQEEMQKILKPLLARMRRGADIANGRIDTTTSYKRVQGRCRNW